MEQSYAIRLQANLGVAKDGNIGPKTLGALFKKMGAKQEVAKALGDAAAIEFPKYGILDNPYILGCFMGQAAHETARFIYFKELASGAAYNGRLDLGNTEPGDGPRYKGRGIFQLTGRANYIKYGKKLGLDLVGNPDLAAGHAVSVKTACEYWTDKKLSTPALKRDVLTITKRINGGTNGLEDRITLTNKALALMGL